MERRRVIMLGITLAIAAWLLADLLLPMTGLTGGGADEGPLVGIAARNLAAGHRVTVEDVEPIAPPADAKDAKQAKDTNDAKDAKAPADHATDPKARIPAAVGRVLARAIPVGGQIHAKDLVPRSTGELIARQLPAGYRAVTVTLRDSTSTVALYPGAMVDVLSTMEVPTGSGNQREAMTRTVVERAKVLAVNEDTIYTIKQQEDGAEERRTTTRKPTVTLALTPEQAAQVEFAGTKGTIGVTLRAEADVSPSLDAVATARRPGQPQAADAVQPAPPAPQPPVVAAKPATPAPAAPVAPAKPSTWDVVILRGKETERVPFPVAPAPDAGGKPKTP